MASLLNRVVESVDGAPPYPGSRLRMAPAQTLLEDLHALHRRLSAADVISVEAGAARKLIAQAIETLSAHKLDAGSGLAGWQILAVDREIKARIAQKIHIATLAGACRLSEAHFCRAFRMARGISPMRYVSDLRVRMAEELLSAGEAPLCEIALACGFSDQAHFTRVFRASTGETPKRWQRRRMAR